MQFGGMQKTSLLDFPDRIATVLFTVGCNLRCPFCHNWRLVLNPKPPFLDEETVFQILESRKRYVDAVAITGGEPTMHKDLPQFLRKLKDRGFKVKLDTNGFFPKILEKCLPYTDYVALDVKTSLEKYKLLGAKDLTGFLQTIEMLKTGKVDYEFRCTVVPGFVNKEDIPKIGELVKNGKRFAFQQFISGDTLDKKFRNVEPYSEDFIADLAEVMKKYVGEVILRV
ncbi:anaerobic ribonucleoside-triphosphate reductase activating protein [Candidatus Bathyarchaeota archaeon]|nr:anaerobic ribonucleoside-triphosphate reductase activating protein [Candidatus Bathyarchaeota archaeon]